MIVARMRSESSEAVAKLFGEAVASLDAIAPLCVEGVLNRQALPA